MVYVRCDLCGSDKHEVIYDKQAHQYQISSRVVRDKDGNILNGRVVVCNDCGLVYTNPRMSEPDLAEFYRNRYRRIYKPSPKLEEQHAQIALEFVKECIPYFGNLLDVGSSMGKFLELVSPLCVSANGIEPGIDGTTLDTYDTEKRYDTITMLDVLEHTASPTKALQKVRSLLSDYGVVVLAVPELFSFKRSLSLDAFFSNAHLYHFSPQTLRALCWKVGLTVIEMKAIKASVLGTDKVYAFAEKCPSAAIKPNWDASNSRQLKQSLEQVAIFRKMQRQGFQ